MAGHAFIKIITKCRSQHHNDKTPYYLDEYNIAFRKIRDGLNIFHAIMVPQNLQPYILYKSHNALGHSRCSRLYNFIKRDYYWKKLHQDCNKHTWSCPKG